MKLFNKFRNNEMAIENLISTPYEQKYIEECRYIWKNYVPAKGPSAVLQGELLRELEKLRYEAQDNGNINWDDDFVYFCDFIRDTLCSKVVLPDDEKAKIHLILNHIKECGEYARKYSEGHISDDNVDISKLAYVDDNLYDIIADAIGLLHAQSGGEIPFKMRKEIKR